MTEKKKNTENVANETSIETLEEKVDMQNSPELKVQVTSMPIEKNTVDEKISKKDRIDFLIKVVTLLITSISALTAALTFYNNNEWKQYDHMSSTISSFSSNPSVNLVNHLLDYNIYKMKVDSNKYVSVNDEMLYEALVVDSIKGDFIQSEYKVRNAFDEYFNGVSALYRETKYAKIDIEYIKPYLGYYTDIIANPNNTRKSEELKKQILGFIRYYGYTDVLELYKKMGYDIDKK
jgi:hypothetical protein